MEVIHAFPANLSNPGTEPVLHAMQYDGARKITVQLYAGTAVWAVPEGVTAGIGYTLPNRQSSYYEQLSDGTAAITIGENTVTAVLAPVLTSIAGEVKASVIFTANGTQLSTFPFRIRVEARPGEVSPGAQPDAASPFVGKLYYGGDMGAPIPLGLGNGVRVVQTEDGSLLLIVTGSGNGSIAEETDPTVPEWAKQAQKPTYTAEEVGADAAGTASRLLGEHNGSPNSHWDVQMELRALSERLTAVLDSDDTTLDQLSEIVAYIKSNKSLIDAITTSKVSVADIVDNLVTNVAGKPLSAAMGVALASDIDSVRSSLGGYLPRQELTSAVEYALDEAKKSGDFDGDPGRGIKSIVRTAGNGAAGTVDTYTITYTDGTTGTYQVRNGANGTNGTNGADGADGDDGITPHIGANGNWYLGDTDTGVTATGPQGPAYTLTDADKQSITAAVVAALPKYAGEVEAV